MGVTLLQVFPDECMSGYKAVERLHSRIRHLGASPSGMFCVDCETYYMVAGNSQAAGNQGGRKLHVLHNTEMPVTTVAVIDTGAKQVILSADLLFDLLLPRLSHMYQSKKNLKIESKGLRFEIGDFIVKVGTVTMSNGQYKGILVEVEYLPCVFPEQCWSILKEFMQSFMGSCVPSETPKYFQNRNQELYSPQDTIHQYLEKFNEFREGSSTNPAPATTRENQVKS